jgi:uncharacterized protein YecA (UPF0149 family)
MNISFGISNGRSSDRAYQDHPESKEFTLFGNTIEELSRWHGFSEEYQSRLDRALEAAEAELLASQPYRNPFKGIGRNDRCPCGSGKKFKQCCLVGNVVALESSRG